MSALRSTKSRERLCVAAKPDSQRRCATSGTLARPPAKVGAVTLAFIERSDIVENLLLPPVGRRGHDTQERLSAGDSDSGETNAIHEMLLTLILFLFLLQRNRAVFPALRRTATSSSPTTRCRAAQWLRTRASEGSSCWDRPDEFVIMAFGCPKEFRSAVSRLINWNARAFLLGRRGKGERGQLTAASIGAE